MSNEQAVLTIDLGAIVANWRDLCALHAPGAVAGVVKADGYGLGAAEVGVALRDAGCRHFFVAHLGEGLALREAIGPGPMIAVLGGFRPQGEAGAEAAAAALVPVINTLGMLDAHAAAGREAGAAVPAILHVDTGMSRLGLDDREAALLAQDHARASGVELLYLMTHLACAEDPNNPLNLLQNARFGEACDRLPPAPRSLANSSGLFLGPEFRSDLARPGCALYGINPTPMQANPVREVVRLDAPVLQIREIPGGATVGYGASWTAPGPARIATVAAGYADGYLRHLSGKGVAAFGDRPVKLVGRVSMDLITFDVTAYPEMVPGDMITLIGGSGCSPDEVATLAGTIGYEVLTTLGCRFERRYVQA